MKTETMPFHSGQERIPFWGDHLYQLDYFRTREDAEAWAAQNGGWVEPVNPPVPTIWRASRKVNA